MHSKGTKRLQEYTISVTMKMNIIGSNQEDALAWFKDWCEAGEMEYEIHTITKKGDAW